MRQQTKISRPGPHFIPLWPARWLVLLSLCVAGTSLAASAEPGRLFYTPAQRAQLESARSRNVTQPAGQNRKAATGASAPLQFDGVMIRSDGQITRWVNGEPQAGASGVAGLKPGQVRATGRIYEPYQVLPPASPSPGAPGVQP